MPPPPQVYQCKTCRCIVGDSQGLQLEHKDLGFIVLRNASNVIKLNSKLQTSFETFDSGSTFVELQCSGCETIIGRCYLTTSRQLDEIRDLSSLYKANLLVYVLQNSQQLKNETVITDNRETSALEEELKRIQQVMVILDERLQALEGE